MFITKLAKQADLPTETVRYYQKLGLLNDSHYTRKENGYCVYNAQALERLKLIKQGKRLGFTLRQLKQWIDDFESGALSLDFRISLFREKLVEVDRAIKELREVRDYLADKLKICEGMREG